MKTEPQRSRGAAWLTAGAITYGIAATGGLGTMMYQDARAPVPIVQQQVLVPPEALAPEPLLPACDASAVLKETAEAEPAAPAAPATPKYVVLPDELNVRAAPGGVILGQYRRGDVVDILDRPARGTGLGWLRTPRGWVAARYVGLEAASPEPTAAVSPGFPCPFPGPLCLPGTTSIFQN